MSQTFSLNPSCIKDLMLNPCVGMIWVISSSDSFFNMVVFPELSNPRTRSLASWSVWMHYLGWKGILKISCVKSKIKNIYMVSTFLSLRRRVRSPILMLALGTQCVQVIEYWMQVWIEKMSSIELKKNMHIGEIKIPVWYEKHHKNSK
jgi:hypothetical protein